MLHPLPLPLSSCLGCIPPLIGLPSLRFYAVGSSLFLLSVCFCLCSLFYRDDVLCWLLLARPFLYAFHAHLRFPVDLVWFRLSCDHGWIRSGSVNVRNNNNNNTTSASLQSPVLRSKPTPLLFHILPKEILLPFSHFFSSTRSDVWRFKPLGRGQPLAKLIGGSKLPGRVASSGNFTLFFPSRRSTSWPLFLVKVILSFSPTLPLVRMPMMRAEGRRA